VVSISIHKGGGHAGQYNGIVVINLLFSRLKIKSMISKLNLTILDLHSMSIQTVLTLKSALADISAATNTCKQSTATFEVFVLWLCNRRYYTRDVIGIKMTYRDYPTMKVSGQNTL